MTKKEIQKILDERGIEYSSSAKKADLEQLLSDSNPSDAGVESEPKAEEDKPVKLTYFIKGEAVTEWLESVPAARQRLRELHYAGAATISN